MQEPPDWFVEPLWNLQQAIVENTGIAPELGMVVSPQLGLRLGLAPGGSAGIRGPSGAIVVQSRNAREDAKLTPGERRLYAAAFAADAVIHSTLKTAKAAAWVAVMLLRDQEAAFRSNVDWEHADAMYDSFKNERGDAK